ncbi:MAG: rhodanese-like domain-containing protein [Anaeromyxobacter sp.]
MAAATLRRRRHALPARRAGGRGRVGETVGRFEPFYLSSYMGRFTLPELLGLPLGVTLVLVVAMALFMFWGGELLEQRHGQGRPWAEIRLAPARSGKALAAGALLLAAAAVAANGQPTPQQVFARLGPAAQAELESRAVVVDPAEVVALRKDLTVQVVVLDLRDEHQFLLFHVGGARRVGPEQLLAPGTVKQLLDQPASTVTFLVGTGEAQALEAWKGLKGLGVPNLYVIEGGMNGWLERYAVPTCVAAPSTAAAAGASDVPRWQFAHATGDQLPASWPELSRSGAFRTPCGEPIAQGGHEGITWPEHAFTKKVKLQTRTVVKGGCG